MALRPWNVDLTHSGVGFAVRHMVVSKTRGRFTRWNATLLLDDADLTKSRISAEIEVDSIDTGLADRDAHLRSADFFDAARFPRMTFEGRSIARVDDERYRVTGDLTIRGTTRPVVLDVEFGGRARDPWGNERTGFVAHTHVDRREFGLQWNQVLETGGVLVGDKVEIHLEVEAIAAAAAQAA
jgi:polyisoprenoid-binding protein YceI